MINLEDRIIASDETHQFDNNATFRVTVPELEKLLYKPIKVLDKGFIRIIDYFGNDAAVVQAARVSYGTGTKKLNEDRGLIRYLMRHRHTTPFEMCEIKFHIKLPIFIARQWIRHRTANVNEYSARYSILGSDFYIPEYENMAKQSTINRQGRGDRLSMEDAKKVKELLEEDAKRCYEHYTYMMNANESGEILDESRDGLSRELARMNLTLNYYTEWYWKIDLNNLLHFISLRADSHAQYEIQEYAKVMAAIVERWAPFTYEAFMDYKVNGMHLSKIGVKVVKDMISGKKADREAYGLSKREWCELMDSLEIEEAV